MAKRHIVEIIDDIDKTPVGDNGGSHTFSLDGRAYEIDLSEKNAALLKDALASFIEAGRRAGRTGATVAPGTRTRPRSETDAIREWARANGYEVNDRGRIAETIIQAYRAS